MEIKQGESRGFEFTLTQETPQGDIPINLTNYSILFQVRQEPYTQVPPFITKEINTETITDGVISDPVKGVFVIKLYEVDFEDIVPRDFYVSIYLVEKDTEGNIVSSQSISGTGNDTAILRYCKC